VVSCAKGLSQVRVLGKKREKSVLILGAGKVAGTCAEYLGWFKFTMVYCCGGKHVT
jgi:glutamyl-tRNA reductase